MYNQFHPILYWSCDNLPMLESMFTCVCWRNSQIPWYYALSKSCPTWDYKLRLIEMCHAKLMHTSLIKCNPSCTVHDKVIWRWSCLYGRASFGLLLGKGCIFDKTSSLSFRTSQPFPTLKCFSIFFVHIILVTLLVIGHTILLTRFVDVPW